MALFLGNTVPCTLLLRENGRSTTRTVHRISIQATDGRFFHLEKHLLPYSMVLDTGDSNGDQHILGILTKPKTLLPPLELWLVRRVRGRDLLWLMVGMFAQSCLLAVVQTVHQMLQ
jgi:hypothetical protein